MPGDLTGIEILDPRWCAVPLSLGVSHPLLNLFLERLPLRFWNIAHDDAVVLWVFSMSLRSAALFLAGMLLTSVP